MIIVVNFDDNGKIFSPIIDSFRTQKIDIPLTEGTQKFFDLLSGEDTSTWTTDTLKSWFESNRGALGELNEGFEDFVEQADPATDLLEQ